MLIKIIEGGDMIAKIPVSSTLFPFIDITPAADSVLYAQEKQRKSP